MIPIYLCLKYLRQEYPAKIRTSYILAIGACFALTFWMKYTMAGLFGGLVLFVVFLQIRDKQLKWLVHYVLLFLAGFLIGSMPVIVYFGYYRAFDSLFQVYFYNLIFIYGGTQPSQHALSWLTESFYTDYIGVSIWPVLWIVCALLSGKRIFSTEEKTSTGFMLFWAAFGVNLGYAQLYSKEYLYVFTVIGLTSAGAVSRELCKNSGKLVQAGKDVHSYLAGEKNVSFLFGLLAAVLVLLDRELFLPMELEAASGVLLVRIWNQLGKRRVVTIGGYVLVLLILAYEFWAVKYEFLRVSLIVALLLKVTDDISVRAESVSQYFRQQIPQWKSEFRIHQRGYGVLLAVLTAVLSVFYMLRFSANTENMDKSPEDFPQYTIAQHILENGGDDPVILYLDIPDPGIYWLTGTYPPEKYFGSYNIDLPEKDAIYEDYEKNKKADYVITSGELDWEGYEFVYSGTSDYGSYWLYEKTE